MEHYWNLFIRYTDSLEPKHWLFVLAALVIVGLVCMRGFGSRSRY